MVNGKSSLIPIHPTTYPALAAMSQNRLIFNNIIAKLLISPLPFLPYLRVETSSTSAVPLNLQTKHSDMSRPEIRSTPKSHQIHSLFLESPHSSSSHLLLSGPSHSHQTIAVDF